MDSPKSEAYSVAELVSESQLPIINPLKGDVDDSTALVVWPKGQRIESLERYLANPRRIRATARLDDHPSFANYVNRFKTASTAIFCQLTEEGGSFAAFMDYHADPVSPGWAEHRANLTLLHTPEWKRWKQNSGVLMDQSAFSQFLEDNRLDILSPSAADVIEISKSIQATMGGRFKSAIRHDNGDRELVWESTTTAGAQNGLTIPEKLTLQLPVFVGGQTYTIEAWFKYRIKEGTLVLFYELIRPHKVIESALKEVREEIEKLTGIPVLAGITSPGTIPA